MKHAAAGERMVFGGRDAARWRRGRAVLLCLSLSTLVAHGPALAEDAPDEHRRGGHEAAPDEGFSPRFDLHGFSDITFSAERVAPPGGGSSSGSRFALGQLDLYMVSRLSSQVMFLGETVFELDESGESVVDVERLFIKYSLSDHFAIAAGRTHTALGYWNESFHHGSLLQPTVDRPEVLKFEDDGGILPVHAVGIEFSGGFAGSSWETHYVANLANGRGLTREAVQGSADANDSKAVAFKLSFERRGKVDLAFGPAMYVDRIPPGPDPLAPAHQEIKERIVGAHFACSGRSLRVLAEAYAVGHEDAAAGTTFDHRAGYAVVVWSAKRLKPYVGADIVSFTGGDPFFAPDDVDLRRYLGGIRFDVNPFNALKFEYRNEDREGEKAHVLAIQTAFTF
jgi:hypothetical protein